MSGKNRDAVPEEILTKAYETGVQNERRCTGCAQSALAAILDVLDIESDDAFRAASGMADGIGLSGDGSCGVLAAGVMAIGLMFGRDREHFSDPFAAMKSYKLAYKLYEDFIERYGSCRCYDIQKKLMGRTYNLRDAKEMEEALHGGMMDHCSKVVGNGARKAVEIILAAREGGTRN